MERILWALILFWNVENYFAPFDFSDPHFGTVSQNAGTVIKKIPLSGSTSEQSRKFRNWKVFSHKRDGMAKTLCLVAERYGRFPDLIGLAEVENRWVIKQLAQNTVLAAQDYGIVHRDSPDSRGIDVALLYRRSAFKLLSVRFIPVIFVSFNSASDTLIQEVADHDTLRTREILYVKGVLRGYDTLHVFVNHWPSKLGGKTAENHRCGIARKLRWLCDSIAASVEGAGMSYSEAKAEDSLWINHCSRGVSNGRQVKAWHGAKIVIMGDFNAGDGDVALGILGGSDCAVWHKGKDDSQEKTLLVDVNDGCFQKYDTMPRRENDMLTEKSGRKVTYEKEVHGSYKYKGEWSTIDRFYVSRYFVEGKEISAGEAEIFSHPFLLEEDRTYLGVKPRRSFIGPKFNGGLSDHLPAVLRISAYNYQE